MLSIFDFKNVKRHASPSVGVAIGLSPGLFLQAIRSSERLRILEQQGKCAPMLDMVAAHAWKDAALELLTLGAPGWSLARLCREDTSWICTLTSRAGLPDWLDDAIECDHHSADAALMNAVLEAVARPTTPQQSAMQPRLAAADCDAYR